MAKAKDTNIFKDVILTRVDSLAEDILEKIANNDDAIMITLAFLERVKKTKFDRKTASKDYGHVAKLLALLKLEKIV